MEDQRAGTQFAQRAFDCPVCACHFVSQIVEAVTHQGQDSDFFPHYLGDNPLPFFLVQCPECNFCGYPDDFQGNVFPTPEFRNTLMSEILKQPLAQKLPQTARKFYLAGKIYEFLKKNPYQIGSLYLRGSWCCRQTDNRRAEMEFQQLAVKFLRASVERSTLTNPDNVPVVTYLIGELYRRLEDREAAREWFGSVEEALFDSEQQWILDLTKKQAELNEHFIN